MSFQSEQRWNYIQAKKDFEIQAKKNAKIQTDAKVQIFDIALSTIVFNQSSIEQTGILLICHAILTSEVNSNICTEIDCMHKKSMAAIEICTNFAF